MGVAKEFSKVLHSEIKVHAAWLPVTNTFRVGDYGLISDGVFIAMGNITELGVPWNTASAPPAALDFKSAGTRVARLTGGVEVPNLPEGDIDAKLVIEFSSENSFLIKTNLTGTLMNNMEEVSRKLVATNKWQRKFTVVSGIYQGENALIVSSRKSNSRLEISGKATALKQLGVGAASAGFEITASQDVGLEILGQSGTVGLQLFKVGFLGFGSGPHVLNAAAARPEELKQADLPDDV